MTDKPTGRHAEKLDEAPTPLPASQAQAVLDEATKERIRQEELYRAQVRAEAAIPLTPKQKQEAERTAKKQQAAATAQLQKENAAREAARRAALTPEQLRKEDQRNLGCATIFAIVLIGGIWGCNARSSRPPTPEQAAANAAQAAAAVEDDKMGAFGVTCSQFVEENLKSPKTADVSNYYTDRANGNFVGTYATGYTWQGYVDAENSFGANIRTRFTCTAGPSEDTVHLKFAGQ